MLRGRSSLVPARPRAFCSHPIIAPRSFAMQHAPTCQPNAGVVRSPRSSRGILLAVLPVLLLVDVEAGKLVRAWGKRGKGDGEFHQPGGIVLRPDGTLYVTDQCNHRVQKFTREGKFLGKWGAYGSKPGQFGAPEPAGSRFGGPHFLTQDSKGRLYTTEGARGRVQQLSAEGQPLLAWGDKGNQ